MSEAIKRTSIAITYKAEKKFLDGLAKKVYKFTTADQLTLLAFLGSIIAALSYWLAGPNLNWLHLVNIGVFLHWFGDSLDGRVAKLRGEGRPKYGHYIDHILDAFSTTIIVVGLHLSPLSSSSIWLFVSIITLLYMVHVHLKTSVTEVFDFTQSVIGPTELRIMLMLFNLAVLVFSNPTLAVGSFSYSLVDWAGYIAFVSTFVILFKNVSDSLWGKARISD